MEPVIISLSEEDEEALAELESELCADRSEVVERLVMRGLEDWRREKALDRLLDHEVTVRKAAEIAGVSYAEMLSLAAEEGIDVGYREHDLERDIDRR